jgi:mono/diheme cytochrome c family protein
MHRTARITLLVLALPIGGGVTAESDITAAESVTPLMELAISTPKGQLKNPYTDFASVAEEGHHKYMAAGCNGCHGGGGGGGMAPPLTNPVLEDYRLDKVSLLRAATRRMLTKASRSSALCRLAGAAISRRASLKVFFLAP